MSYQINHPWYVYPNEPLSGYKKYEIYKNEIIKLMSFIQNFEINNHTVFHLIIGAAMEEFLASRIEDPKYEDITFQWRQLFPFWIENYLNYNPDGVIRILIVSPNKEFSENYIPLFVQFTNEKFNWKINNNTISSQTYNIVINIFCTPFPSIDKNSEKKINHYKKFISKNEASNLIVTHHDTLFVKRFNKYLTKLFNNIILNKGIIISTSYAVFNKNSDLINIKRYKMFLDIYQILKKVPRESCLITEWIFKPSCYCTINLLNPFNGITYVEPTKLYNDGHIPIIEFDNDKLIIRSQLANDYINLK